MSVTPLVVERNGVRLMGVPASIASELLHRRRTLVEEQGKLLELDALLTIAKDEYQVVREQVPQAKAFSKQKTVCNRYNLNPVNSQKMLFEVNAGFKPYCRISERSKHSRKIFSAQRTATATRERQQKEQKREVLNGRRLRSRGAVFLI